MPFSSFDQTIADLALCPEFPRRAWWVPGLYKSYYGADYGVNGGREVIRELARITRCAGFRPFVGLNDYLSQAELFNLFATISSPVSLHLTPIQDNTWPLGLATPPDDPVVVAWFNSWAAKMAALPAYLNGSLAGSQNRIQMAFAEIEWPYPGGFGDSWNQTSWNAAVKAWQDFVYDKTKLAFPLIKFAGYVAGIPDGAWMGKSDYVNYNAYGNNSPSTMSRSFEIGAIYSVVEKKSGSMIFTLGRDGNNATVDYDLAYDRVYGFQMAQTVSRYPFSANSELFLYEQIQPADETSDRTWTMDLRWDNFRKRLVEWAKGGAYATARSIVSPHSHSVGDILV